MSSLTNLFGQLEVYSKTDSHKKVYDTARDILIKDKNNLSAFKQCLVSLINLDNYSDAKKLISDYSDLISSNTGFFVLELAYIYYKLNVNEDTILKLADVTSTSNLRGFNHILAQYYYKNGDDVKALELYQLLIASDNESTNESFDLSVNERAVFSQLKFQNNYIHNFNYNKINSSSFVDSYDKLFNDALILIIEKNYSKAIDYLNKTLDLANISLKDYDSDEKFIEIASIQLQLAYVYILISKYDDAMEILNILNNQVLEINNSNDVNNDINLQILNLLINNNRLVCIQNSTSNFEPALLYRELELPTSLSISKSKLTLPQLSILERNHLLLSFFTGKQSKKSIQNFNKTYPSSLLPNALNSGISMQDIVDSNNKLFYKLSTKSPENLPLALIAVQIAINSNNYQRAILILENVTNYNEKFLLLPAIGKLLYSLYESLDCKKLISQLLTKIHNLLMDKDLDTFTNEDIKYSKFISLKLLSTDDLLAKQLLSKINESEMLNIKFSDDDVTKLVKNVDVDVIITEGISPLIKSSHIMTNSNINNLSGKITKSKRIRSKPKKLPKEISQQIDNERWLPMKDRSYYKMKKSKKSKNTQGGAIDAATEKALNISSSVNESKPVTPTTTNSSSSAKKNKKKKGKK